MSDILFEINETSVVTSSHPTPNFRFSSCYELTELLKHTTVGWRGRERQWKGVDKSMEDEKSQIILTPNSVLQ